MNSELKKNNFLILRNFIDEFRAKKLATEFEYYCLENDLKGDGQAQQSSSCHNYLPFVRLLIEKTQPLSELVGEDLLPTYTYARVYKNGADLKIHTDRPACEISITLNLNKDKDWPIFIKTPLGKTAKVEMKPGDGMLYLGCIAEHWRDTFDGEKYTQVFMHYVKSFGENAWAFFDKEKNNTTNYVDEIPLTIL